MIFHPEIEDRFPGRVSTSYDLQPSCVKLKFGKNLINSPSKTELTIQRHRAYPKKCDYENKTFRGPDRTKLALYRVQLSTCKQFAVV